MFSEFMFLRVWGVFWGIYFSPTTLVLAVLIFGVGRLNLQLDCKFLTSWQTVAGYVTGHSLFANGAAIPSLPG